MSFSTYNNVRDIFQPLFISDDIKQELTFTVLVNMLIDMHADEYVFMSEWTDVYM